MRYPSLVYLAIMAACAFVVLFGFAFGAFAQTAIDGQVIDMGPAVSAMIEWVGPIVLIVAMAIGLWLLTKLGSLFGLKINALQRAVVEQGLSRAIGYAITRLGDRAAGGIPITVKNEAIAVAADYAARSIPGALKHFSKSRDDLAEMIEARLQGVLIEPDAAASSPRPLMGRAFL